MKVKNISISELKPYPQNAKQHPPEQVNHVANSIKEFGWQQPIVIDSNNEVIIGHCRLLAAKKLKLKEVPCVQADTLTDEQVKALRLADNRTNESEWDLGLLNIELDNIFELDMSGFGFDIQDKEEAELERKELLPYTTVHYLLSFDINIHDEILPLIHEIEKHGEVEVESTLN